MKEPEETSIINFSKLENQEMEELDKKIKIKLF